MCKFNKQLKRMPMKVKNKALSILEKINLGESSLKLGCKRLRCCGRNRHIISAPIGRGYRVLMLKMENTIQPFWIGTHEAYNTKIAQL